MHNSAFPYLKELMFLSAKCEIEWRKSFTLIKTTSLTNIIVPLCLEWIIVTLLSHCLCLELNSVDLKGCGSDNSLNSNASLPSVQCHRRHTERRVASWAVCFERLLQDPVGVRYFSVCRISPSHPFAKQLHCVKESSSNIGWEYKSCFMHFNWNCPQILSYQNWHKAFSKQSCIRNKTTKKCLERILLVFKTRNA